MFENIITFPFVQIADGLRYLSLSSQIGNIVAIMVYLIICLIPMVYFAFKWTKHNIDYIDALLPFISILSFVVLYQLINPGLLNSMVATKALPCITIYSVVFTYLLLKILKLFQGKTIEQLSKYLIVLLWAVNVLFAYSIIFTYFYNFPQKIKELQAANSGNTGLLGTTYFFMFFGTLVDSIPMVSGIVVVYFAIQLVKHFSADLYSEQTVLSAVKLSNLCKTTVMLTVFSTMIFNILQFIFTSQLLQINSNINIPLLSIVFVLAVFVLSQIISKNKALKDDNDSII